MATKYFCDECDAEISARVGDYARTECDQPYVTFKIGVHDGDARRVKVIYPEFGALLCRKCLAGVLLNPEGQ